MDEVPVTTVANGEIDLNNPEDAEYGEQPDSSPVWGIVTNDASMPGGIRLIIEKIDEEKAAVIEKSVKNAVNGNGELVAANGSTLNEEKMKELVGGKKVASALDIYLLKNSVKITEFNGVYTVKILLTEEQRRMIDAQVVYVRDDGTVEVFETTIEEDKYLVFSTTHFSEFYVLETPTLNLWWLIIALSVILLLEIIAIAFIIAKREKDKNGNDKSAANDGNANETDKTSKAYAFAPVLLSAIIIPDGAGITCIVLGALIVCATAALICVALKMTKEGEENAEPVVVAAGTENAAVPTDKEEKDEGKVETVNKVACAVRECEEEAEKESLFCTATPDESKNGEDEEEDAGVAFVNGREVLVRYNRSFRARLIQSKEQTKEFYALLHNYVMSYEKVRNRESWAYSSYATGRQKVLILTVKGKSLYMYAALTEEETEDIKYPTELSDKKRYENTPMQIKVKSMRGVAAAKKMIDRVMAKYSREAGECKNSVNAADYPYEDTQTLIGKKLIKLISLNGETIDEDSAITLASVSLSPKESVSAEEARSLMSDEQASEMLVVADREKYVVAGKKFAINIDTLSANFENGDEVNIRTLKAKGLVPQKTKAIKILARGVLDKRLITEAEDYSYDAIKMIALVGGTAYKLRIPDKEEI